MADKKPALRIWLAIGRDDEGIFCFHFTTAVTDKERAKAIFEKMVKKNEWEPLRDVQVYTVDSTPEVETMRKVAFFSVK